MVVLFNAHCEYFFVGQKSFEQVFGRYGTNACGRSGENHIAGFECDEFRNMRNDMVKRENQIFAVAVLHNGSVFSRRNSMSPGKPDSVSGMNSPMGAEQSNDLAISHGSPF